MMCDVIIVINAFMDGALHETRARWHDYDATLKYGETEWRLPQLLYAADDAVLAN